MAAIDPDDLPKKKSTHELGQDLGCSRSASLPSASGLLKGEITRLEAEMNKKRASQTAANAFFKK